jgi:putative endonuclease
MPWLRIDPCGAWPGHAGGRFPKIDALVARAARGRLAEELVAQFLALGGYTVLARNTHWAGVEVDLVARHGDLLVLVEVKLRRVGAAVSSCEACRPPQQARLRRAAATLLARSRWASAVRIDVVGVDCGDEELRLRHWRGVTSD